jgi:hypothetical protein
MSTSHDCHPDDIKLLPEPFKAAPEEMKAFFHFNETTERDNGLHGAGRSTGHVERPSRP